MNTTSITDTNRLAIENILEYNGVHFVSSGGVDTLIDHVDRHRDLINREYGISATWEEALFSWYENVFTPIIRTVSPGSYRRAFGHVELGDLYLAVSDHWGYLKEKHPDVPLTAAARSFLEKYGTGIGRYFSRFLIPVEW